MSFDSVSTIERRPAAPPEERGLEISKVSVNLGGRLILQDIDFTLRKGKVMSVIGPSGSGKTTLLRTLGGLISPTSGYVMQDRQPVSGPKRDIAIVFQDYGKALLPWRTAAGNVDFALEACGVPKRQRAHRIHELLTTMKLADHANKYPGEMSGGMQQRLQIARCLAQDPSVILMDEPFGALDAMTRQVLQDEVLRIAAGGTSIFFVTHDLEEAIYIGDRILALTANPGRIDQMIEVRFDEPRNQLTTREHPDFLSLRHQLFSFLQEA